MTTAGFLREHIDVAFERGKFDDHEIQTPWNLVDEIVDQIPIMNSALVLYNPEFVWAMHERGWDLSALTLYADSPSKKKWADKIGIKYIQEGIEYGDDMKFDVVVGNPPYDEQGTAKNKKLWAKFIEFAIDLTPEYIAFVTPNNILSSKGVNGQNSRKKISMAGYGFQSARLHDEKVFKGFGVATCHWIVKKDASDAIDPILNDDREIIDPIVASICNKVVNYDHMLKLTLDNSHVSRDMCKETAGNEIMFSGQKVSYTKEAVNNEKVLKFVFPFSSSYHKMFVSDRAIGMLNLYIPIKDEKEGAQIRSYADSKLMKFVAARWNKTSGFCPFVKNSKVPDLRGKMWSDKELYAHFELTDEEIAYIESNSL